MKNNKQYAKQKSHDFYKYLGARLKYYRKLNEYSQMRIAKELGVTFQQVQKYESGVNNIPVERLIIFAKNFNLSLEELLGETFYPKQTKFSNELLKTLCFAKRLKASKIFKNI
ncbi:MAG: helix-turn-helix domain-containing protein [Alphaproteobacteria bacterium]